jgi:hypothetical protein
VQGKMTTASAPEPAFAGRSGKIEKNFLVTFIGLMHERIRYPGTELNP